MPLSVSHVWVKLKKPIEVFRGSGGDFGLGNVEQLGQCAGRLDDKSRFVTLAALRCRREPGRVGFDEYSIQRHARGYVAQRLRLGVSQVPRK